MDKKTYRILEVDKFGRRQEIEVPLKGHTAQVAAQGFGYGVGYGVGAFDIIVLEPLRRLAAPVIERVAVSEVGLGVEHGYVDVHRKAAVANVTQAAARSFTTAAMIEACEQRQVKVPPEIRSDHFRVARLYADRLAVGQAFLRPEPTPKPRQPRPEVIHAPQAEEDETVLPYVA